MSEQAVEERRGWPSDIMSLYSILVLLVMMEVASRAPPWLRPERISTEA
jgi:hypothetical protein